ncbi:MAG: hypothetical protein IJG15_03970 [Lachnospiraceae bacterium]|nr:hypothetical protein [Lachnospiraceae bacterium]
MAIQKKPCLVCGRLFKPCSTITEGLNWRRSFCSPECCQEWMRRQTAPEPEPEHIVEEAVEEQPVETVKPTRRVSRKEKDE